MTSEFERVANPFGSGAADFARIFYNTMQLGLEWDVSAAPSS
jgi:hypothetical protein